MRKIVVFLRLTSFCIISFYAKTYNIFDIYEAVTHRFHDGTSVKGYGKITSQ
ncbi:hypothetical protein [Psychroserpens sp.]|uniref:hypothetical protein n=1 Tax=Psychroserpens sp. TaxID=2020870 RepID=UPI0039E49CBB